MIFWGDDFLNIAQKCENTLEPPEGGGFMECTQSMFKSKNKKQIDLMNPCTPQFYVYKRSVFGGLRYMGV